MVLLSKAGPGSPAPALQETKGETPPLARRMEREGYNSTTLLTKNFENWALKGPKSPENSEHMTFQKVERLKSGEEGLKNM